MSITLVIALGLYVVIDLMSIGLGTEQRPAYGALLLITGLVLLAAKWRPPLPRSVGRIAAVWWIIGAIGFVMVFSQETIYPLYVVGDAASFLYPALLLVIARKDASVFFHVPTIRILGAFMLLASIGAVLIPMLSHNTERFQEPPLLLMALGWIGMIRPKRIEGLASSILISVAVLQLTVMSGARFALVLWPMMGIALFAMGHVSKRMAAVALCMLLGVAVTADVAIEALDLTAKIDDSRMGRFLGRIGTESLADGIFFDASMNNRMLEASDAFYTRYDYQSWPAWLLGSGHGATFEGDAAYYGERETDSGDVHHIHFGLMLLYYRYGIPGVCGFLWLFATVLHQMLVLRRCPANAPLYYPSLVFTLAAIAYLLNFLLFNELIDPVFSFTIAGFLTTRDLSRQTMRHARRRVARKPTPEWHESPTRGFTTRRVVPQ
jgi:hypothetical protein